MHPRVPAPALHLKLSGPGQGRTPESDNFWDPSLAGSAVWSQRPISLYLDGISAAIDTDSDGRSSGTRSSSLGSGSNTGSDTRTLVIEFELSDLEDLDLDSQPSLGLLDGALSFIAAERARWTAQREADVIANEEAWEEAWEHVVEARRKHRRKRMVRKSQPDDASRDDHIEEEESLAAEDADDSSSSFDNTTLTTTTTHTIPASPSNTVPSTPFRSRKEWRPQQARTDTSPSANHMLPFPQEQPFAQANPRDRPPGASATLIHVNILIGLLAYLRRYSIPPPPAHSLSASVSVTHAVTPVIPKGLTMDALSALYPQGWNEFTVEIPPEPSQQISDMTWTKIRPRFVSDWNSDLGSRITAMLLAYSSTPMAHEKILTTLGINLKDYGIAFDSMVRAVDRNNQGQSILARFDSEEFWISAKLKNWLLACYETLCHGVWHTPIPPSERIQLMDYALYILPCNLAIYACSLVRRPHGHEFRGFDVPGPLDTPVPDFLGALQRYSQDVHDLVGLVRQSVRNSPANHTTSARVHQHMDCDLAAVVARLVLFLRDDESYKEFLRCRGTDAQLLLDFFQDFLDLGLFSGIRPLLFEALLRLSRSSGLHPRCLPLLGLQKVGQQLAGGAFGDIWKGLVRGQSVCVKIMRIFENSNIQAVLKEFGREALICRQLCHPNVLPFFGVYYFDNRLCLVSPWMEDGHIMKFLAAKQPTTTERLSLILDVALGLQYLHEQNIVHGDLKGANILVTPSHRACIADFGVSSIVKAITVRFTHTTADKGGGTTNYSAPELFPGHENHFGSDVYAFSCVCYEIMTGNAPFHDLQGLAVMFRVAAGDRPSRPTSCSASALDGLWELMQQCWEQDAEARPKAAGIVEQLVGPSIGTQATPFAADWDDTLTSKFRRSLQAEPLLPTVTQIERMLFGDEAVKACRECFPDQQRRNASGMAT